MENTAKALILTLVVCLGACKPKAESPRPPSQPFTAKVKSESAPLVQTGVAEPTRISLGNGLYSDSNGVFYLKVENRRPRHPSQLTKDRPDSIFQSNVYSYGDSGRRSLAEIVDRKSFLQVDPEGIYFMDSSHIYVYSTFPYPEQFFALKKQSPKFLGQRKEYLLNQGELLSRGQWVKGLDNSKVHMLRFKGGAGSEPIEFITDGKRIFTGPYQLDSDRLQFVEGLTDQDRRTLEGLVRKQPPPLE